MDDIETLKRSDGTTICRGCEDPIPEGEVFWSWVDETCFPSGVRHRPLKSPLRVHVTYCCDCAGI